MKSLAFQIAFIFISLSSSGQTYFSFIDTNSVWRDLNVSCGHNASYLRNDWWNMQIFIKGDTVSGNTYKKLYTTGIKYHSLYDHGYTEEDTTTFCEVYYGALREDSLKHVFYLDTFGVERLLYDFNLVVGDSMQFPKPYAPGYAYCHVLSIDSVFVYDRFRKRMNFDYGFTVIEGIGGNFGLFGSIWTNSPCLDDRSKAYFYNGVKAYNFPSYFSPQDSLTALLDCNTIRIDEIDDNPLVFIYPNPISDIVNIEFKDGLLLEEYSVIIFDYSGRVVLNQSINKNKTEIDLSKNAAGVYFLKLRSSDGAETIYRIVKI